MIEIEDKVLFFTVLKGKTLPQHEIQNQGSLELWRNLCQYNLHSVLPPGIRGGDDFCVIRQAGGATAKLQEPGWGHIQGGGMILGSQAGGNCFIVTNCWYFHKMLHLEFYKFRLQQYLIFF